MSQSYVGRFVSEEYDLGPRQLGELAEHCYVICATPRSGSNLLADALRTSGGLGVPMEYLDDTAAEAALAQRWEAGDIAEYFAHLHARRTSDTGWFGLKVHWHQLQQFFERLDGRPYDPSRAQELRLVVENLFPDTRWIRMRREDRVGAAVSLYRATQTGAFVRLDGGAAAPADPGLGEDAIARMLEFVELLEISDAGWDHLIDSTGIDAHQLTFTGLTGDVPGTVAGVRSWLGVGPGDPPAPTTNRQSSDWSVEARGLLEDALASGRGT